MITLELHYAKTSLLNDDEKTMYQTWEWNDDTYSQDYGWNKHPVPNFSSSEEDKAKKWFHVSNHEDFMFLERERIEFETWHTKEVEEIRKSI